MQNKIVFIICGLCVVIGGMMPYVSSALFDSYISSINDTRILEFQEASATNELDVKDVMILLNSDHDELEYNGETHLSIFNIGTYAKTITEQLIEQELLPVFDFEKMNIKASVYLINSKKNHANVNIKGDLTEHDKEFSIKSYALVWKCDFYNLNDIRFSIQIDDNSGKLVSMFYAKSNSDSSKYTDLEDLESSQGIEMLTNKYTSFFNDYYSLENKELIELNREKMKVEFVLPITSDSGYYEEIQLLFHDDFIFFNY